MEESSFDHGQKPELQNHAILSKVYQEGGGSTGIKYKREPDSQITNKSTFADFSRNSTYRQSYETIKNTEKIQHERRAVLSHISFDAEYDNDAKDIVEKELRSGCDKISVAKKQNILIFPYELKNLCLNPISSDKNLRVNVSENSSTNIKDTSCLNLSANQIVSTPRSNLSAVSQNSGQNTSKASDYKFENDIKEQNPNDIVTIGETTISPYARGQLQEIVEDRTHKTSIAAKDHWQNAIQQSNFENKSYIHTSIANTREAKAIEASTISRSLSAQKTDLSLKTQSLDSRPIYPNVPYSPYASPYSSPISNRRRTPLRESRRVSIEQSGTFLQLNQYKLLDQIGQGSYGLVKLAYSEEDSTHYAMKILSKHRLVRYAGLIKRGQKQYTSPLDRVYREIAVLKKLDHPNVVKLVEVLDDPVEDSLYMVFELVKQGEVLSIPSKNPLSEERAWSVFRDTLLGLEYLHYQRIIHADIKPGNLLLTECGRVKIADLGVCNEFIGEDAIMTNGSTAGTPAFRAPETLNVGQNIYCGKAADIWALGATLYALLYGNVPFVASSIPALYEKIKTEKLHFPDMPKTSAELKDCIQRMLRKDPALRINLPQLKEHAWVNAGGLHALPSEEENCRLVQVDDDDINSVVRSIPKLDTLILIKTMLKKHSFGNPFSSGLSGRVPQNGVSRLERLFRAGRSNSAPGTYNMAVNRQLSGDNILPALCEHSPSS